MELEEVGKSTTNHTLFEKVIMVSNTLYTNLKHTHTHINIIREIM